MAASSRLVVLLSPADKRAVRRRAQALGMNVSEYVRAMTTGDVDAVELELLARTKDAAEQSIAMIDETLAFVNASNARMAVMEASSPALGANVAEAGKL